MLKKQANFRQSNISRHVISKNQLNRVFGIT